MRLSYEELTANIDDDFKAVIARLQKRIAVWVGGRIQPILKALFNRLS